MHTPTSIKLKDIDNLEILWNNDTTHIIPLKFMRDESPDAGNKGETILWKQYDPPEKGPDKPGKYEVAGIEVVGSYAISIVWKDGNQDGIYSYDLLYKWGEYFSVTGNLHEDFEHNHED